MKTKALFGFLLGIDAGGAVVNFVMFASAHRWVNLGSGLFCLACGVFVIFMMRMTLETQAHTREIEAETRRIEEQTALLRAETKRRLEAMRASRNGQ